MSKERLEEIEDRVLKNRAHYKTIGTDEGYWGYSYELSDKDYKWLIEQAERAQELEEWQEKAQQLHESLKRQDEVLDRLRQQNKSYREAIFKALDALPVGFKNEAVRILGEALEGEE